MIQPLYFLSGSIFPIRGIIGGVGFLEIPAELRQQLRDVGIYALGGGWVVQLPVWLQVLVYANPISYLLDLMRWALLGFRQLPMWADLTVAFNGMADAIEATEHTRRRLLSDLAHELRTPLATLEAYHEALVDGVVEPSDETWTTLQDATDRLQRLVEDLATVSRAEEGRLDLDLTDVNLREVVLATVESLRPTAHAAGVTVDTALPEQTLLVRGDADRLGQVLANLLRNALEHTPPEGTITVMCQTTDGHVLVDVADTGAGIAVEHLPHLFDRFYRADPSRRHTGGSGIGLTISRAIARGHGGELSATSAGPRHGATFTLRLPR